MCGLAGIISWDRRYAVSRELLAAMSARIAHRGPDGEGVFLNRDGEADENSPAAGLVHRRLAIIDPGPRADQPFTDGQGHWLIFNGEIYNYRELRKQLEGLLPQWPWNTTCDTEVLLASYVAWGRDCVRRFNGMFAFAIWDENRRELFLARDRMGQKPLYVAYLGHGGVWAKTLNYHFPPEQPPLAVAFASELPALTVIPWVDTAQQEGALEDYLQWGYCLSNETFYRGIRYLEPGTVAWISDKGCDIQPYDARVRELALDDATAKAQTRALVAQAVRRQLVSDVPLGFFLSGGVDSSVIAAAARLAAPDQRLLTFSIGFDDPCYDESKYALKVARHLRTEHHSFTVKPDAAADLPKLAAVFGEPFADSSALPTHYLARETRQHVKVALSGDGGDELFGGYDRYRAMQLGRRLRRFPGPGLMQIFRSIAGALPGVHPKGRIARLKRFLRTIDWPDEQRYSSYVRLFDDQDLVSLLGRPLKPDSDAVLNLVGALVASKIDPVNAARAWDQNAYLPNDLLTKVDRASMLHALEVRSPFMDHEVAQLGRRLTVSQLLKGGPKRMLREAFADVLPPWVFTRKKMGFALPIGPWLRQELRPMLHDYLFATGSYARGHFAMPALQRLVDQHQRGAADHSQRLYALLMLELWWKNQRKTP